MRVIVQRSLESYVEVNQKIVGKIDKGLTLLVGFSTTDNTSNVEKMVKKILNLRIFNDEYNIMNKSILDTKEKILSISQFTLYADTKKGNRPSYQKAMKSEKAIELYKEFNQQLSEFVQVETGVFGEEMKVNMINDGPVSIILEV